MSTKITKALFILGVVGVLLVVAAAVKFIGDQYGNQCLNSDDYKDLTNNSELIANPKDNFYTRVMEFSDTAITSQEEQSVINSLISFYKTHHRKSMIISLSSLNQNTTTNEVAEARINNFAGQLVQGGVKEAIIKKSAPQFLQLDSDYDGTLTVSMVTGEECRQ